MASAPATRAPRSSRWEAAAGGANSLYPPPPQQSPSGGGAHTTTAPHPGEGGARVEDTGMLQSSDGPPSSLPTNAAAVGVEDTVYDPLAALRARGLLPASQSAPFFATSHVHRVASAPGALHAALPASGWSVPGLATSSLLDNVSVPQGYALPSSVPTYAHVGYGAMPAAGTTAAASTASTASSTTEAPPAASAMMLPRRRGAAVPPPSNLYTNDPLPVASSTRAEWAPTTHVGGDMSDDDDAQGNVLDGAPPVRARSRFAAADDDMRGGEEEAADVAWGLGTAPHQASATATAEWHSPPSAASTAASTTAAPGVDARFSQLVRSSSGGGGASGGWVVGAPREATFAPSVAPAASPPVHSGSSANTTALSADVQLGAGGPGFFDAQAPVVPKRRRFEE